MKLNLSTRSIDNYEKRLICAINSGKCLVYLDTSTLTWTLRINTLAREQFVGWCRALGDRIRIPVWAAHELRQHLIENTVLKDIRQRSSDCERKLDDFICLAAEHSDDDLARSVGAPSSDILIEKVKNIREQVRKFSTAVRNNNPTSANEKIIEFVNEFVLDSDLSEIFKELSTVGKFRYSHRVPPGFQDRSKSENKYGDLVIWEEILRNSISEDISDEEYACIFVSQDQKSDWISLSPLVEVGNRRKKDKKEQPKDVPLVHPLLQHEYKKRGGAGSVFVVTPRRLSIIASKSMNAKPGLSLKVDEWVKISYLGRIFADLLNTPIEDGDGKIPSSNGTSLSQAAANRDTTRAFPTVDDVFAGSVSTRLEKVQDLDNAASAAVLDSWLPEVVSGNLQPHIFGRLLASIPAQNIIQVVSSTLTKAQIQVSAEDNARILFGLGVALYFGSNKTLHAMPSNQLGGVFLERCLDPFFSHGLSTLVSALKEIGLAKTFIPGSPSKVLFEVESSGSNPKILTELRIDGNVVTQTVADKTGKTITDYIQDERNMATAEQLKLLVCKLYIIDPERMNNPSGKREFLIRPEMGLVELDLLSPEGFQLPSED